MFDLAGKVAIVTGGARGIGRGISLALAKQGASVAIIDIRTEQAEATVAEIKKLGRQAVALKCDVTSNQEVNQAAKKVLDTYGRIDILVNNVGWDKIVLFNETTPEIWDKRIDINYKSVLNWTKAVIGFMMQNNTGRIINIGSDAGRGGSMGEAVYSGCKGAVIAFTKTMARELARNKVTVNCVCPGPTDTPLMEEHKNDSPVTAKILESMAKVIPLGRIGKPEDLGAAVAFFASDEAGFITGQTVSVSGGLTMM